MLSRVTSILLALVLCFAVLPFGNTSVANTKATTRSQGSALELSQTRVDLPDGGRMLNLTGQYQVGSQRVNLRSVTIASKLNGGVTPSSPNMPEPGEQEYRPEEDYYYSYSEMSRSDGTPLAQATYEFEEPTDRSMLYITIGGVTLSFNVNTQELGPVTEADLERANQWLASEDGRLVQDTSVAIIEYGDPEANWELLLNFYSVAMLVDNNPPLESAKKLNSKARSLAHHARRRSLPISQVPGILYRTVRNQAPSACQLPSAHIIICCGRRFHHLRGALGVVE
jgi:hypothetical protein